MRLLDLNSATAGVAAGCLMSLGSPLSFAAARGAMLSGGLTPGELVLVRYLVAGPLMLPVLIYFGVSGFAGIGWRRRIILVVLGGPSFTLLQTADLVMAIAVHPFVTGQPHRIGALDAALEYICSHTGVWRATGWEIVQHYLSQQP